MGELAILYNCTRLVLSFLMSARTFFIVGEVVFTFMTLTEPVSRKNEIHPRDASTFIFPAISFCLSEGNIEAWGL